jgi:hypothetical protein
MFNINEFFSTPLSKEGKELKDELLARPVTGWKPRHDPRHYDARVQDETEREEVPEHASEFQEKVETTAMLAERINTVVERNQELDKSIYEFLLKRSSSKYSSLRGKDAVYKLFIELNAHESVTQFRLEHAVNRLIELSGQSIIGRTGTRTVKKGGGNAIGRGHAQSLICRLYGYGQWQDLVTVGKLNRGQIQNLRYGQPALIAAEGMVAMRPAVRALAAGKPVGEAKDTARPVKSREGMRMAGVSAKDMAWFVRDYGSQFRTPWLQGHRSELREIAVKRFFGLDKADDLAPYLKLRVFPPKFNPSRITNAEIQLAQHFAKEENRNKTWTAMSAFLELRPWCATPAIEKELEETIGALARGKPSRFAQFFRRKYGVVMLILDHEAGIGLITEGGKITKITRLINRPGKVRRPERPVKPVERQPEIVEPPRIVLTSHDPAFKSAFKDLHKRNQ